MAEIDLKDSCGGEEPVLQGVIQKKVGWMYYKKRNMALLSNPPRLIYFDPENGKQKGIIELNKDHVIEQSDKAFTIDGVLKKEKKKKYFFKECTITAAQWVAEMKKQMS